MWRTYMSAASMAMFSLNRDFKILIFLVVKPCFHLLFTLLISSSPLRDDQLMKCLGLRVNAKKGAL